jgi:methionyl-tRNA formyltransferase
VTLHDIVGRADAGDIIGQERVPIGPDDTAIDLYRALLPAAEALLHRHLDGILAGTAPRTPQDDAQATVFGGRCPEDGRIDWAWPAARIHNLVRAVTRPWPGAFSDGPNGRTMVWKTRVLPAGDLAPGQVRADRGRVVVGTGEGLLELLDTTPGPLRDGDTLVGGPQEIPQ